MSSMFSIFVDETMSLPSRGGGLSGGFAALDPLVARGSAA